MRLRRAQIDAIHSAMQDTVADEVDVTQDASGKTRVSVVEKREVLRPISLTKKSTKNKVTA